jgi:CspA family cold shock protein
MIKKSLLAVLALSSAMAMASPALAACPGQASGTVKFFNDAKGFGFIKSEADEEIFFHVSGLIDDVKQDDKVCFTMEMGKKGQIAVNVRLDR